MRPSGPQICEPRKTKCATEDALTPAVGGEDSGRPMLISEIIWVALGAIRANKLRSFLTTLGIIIGVSAVIAMVSLGEGAQRVVEDQISQMGTNVLTIRADQRRSGGVSTQDTEDLSVTDAEALRIETSGLLTISPDCLLYTSPSPRD